MTDYELKRYLHGIWDKLMWIHINYGIGSTATARAIEILKEVYKKEVKNDKKRDC